MSIVSFGSPFVSTLLAIRLITGRRHILNGRVPWIESPECNCRF
jgi:hypothetical protein